MVHRALRMWSSGVIRHGDKVCPETYSFFGTTLRRHCALTQILGPVGGHGFRRGMARHLARSGGGVSKFCECSLCLLLGSDDLRATVIARLFTDASDYD